MCHTVLLCKQEVWRQGKTELALLFPLPFPHQKVRAVFQLRDKILEFLSGQHQRTDFAFDIAFSFSAEIIQVILVNVSHQHQIDNAGILAFGIVVNDIRFF